MQSNVDLALLFLEVTHVVVMLDVRLSRISVQSIRDSVPNRIPKEEHLHIVSYLVTTPSYYLLRYLYTTLELLPV